MTFVHIIPHSHYHYHRMHIQAHKRTHTNIHHWHKPDYTKAKRHLCALYDIAPSPSSSMFVHAVPFRHTAHIFYKYIFHRFRVTSLGTIRLCKYILNGRRSICIMYGEEKKWEHHGWEIPRFNPSERIFSASEYWVIMIRAPRMLFRNHHAESAENILYVIFLASF